MTEKNSGLNKIRTGITSAIPVRRAGHFNRNYNGPREAEDVQHGGDYSLDSDDNKSVECLTEQLNSESVNTP